MKKEVTVQETNQEMMCEKLRIQQLDKDKLILEKITKRSYYIRIIKVNLTCTNHKLVHVSLGNFTLVQSREHIPPIGPPRYRSSADELMNMIINFIIIVVVIVVLFF